MDEKFKESNKRKAPIFREISITPITDIDDIKRLITKEIINMATKNDPQLMELLDGPEAWS